MFNGKREQDLSVKDTSRRKERSPESIEVSIVLPAHNEEEYLYEAVELTLTTLEECSQSYRYEIIIVEDGCDDRTPEIAAKLALADERVHHIHNDKRLGLGRALEKGFQTAKGPTLVYFDVDMSTNTDYLEELIESVRSREYDFATGSRRMSDRESIRRVLSWLYNHLVRLVFSSRIKDHQCGFKAFDREALFDLLDLVESKHWVWTTEVLIYAQKRGFSIREFPVNWTRRNDSEVNIIKDGTITVVQLTRLWWRLQNSEIESSNFDH